MIDSNLQKNNSIALEAENVSKSFSSKNVLEKISLKVEAGSGVCVYGRNASGKTTLLRILGGILQAENGVVKICGLDIKKSADKAMAMIGVISHGTMTYPQLTIEENLKFFADVYNLKNKKDRIAKIVEEMNLSQFRYDIVSSLSRGTRQRLAIGRAILHSPKVLLADEPFTGLDDKSRQKFIDIINKFRKNGGALVLTSHNVELAKKCCEKIAVLAGGKFTAEANICDFDVKKLSENYQASAKGKI